MKENENVKKSNDSIKFLKKLYCIYLLAQDYVNIAEPNQDQLDSLIFLFFGHFDSKIKSLTYFRQQLNEVMNNEIKIRNLKDSDVFEFKIKDIICTGLPTSEFDLKFILSITNSISKFAIYENGVERNFYSFTF